MKILLQSIAIVSILFSCSISFHATFKSIKCSSSSLSIYPNYSCYIKPYKKNIATMSILLHLRKKTYKCNIDITVLFKQKISAYYRTIVNTTVDLCEFLSGSDKNKLLKLFYDVVIEYVPKELNHPCPFEGTINIYNISFANANLTDLQKLNLPDGFFKGIVRYYNKWDQNIISFQLVVEITDKKNKDF
ncbi:hypothetical protein PVAND_012775 [Polypedilum vanderplanki]|uniref:MD-2-related lipid-recognition domain-containing protein n=1 Tax=Polypedilum vanderplanki TaxID=319348 RepID=A0A9J6CNK7_POLVA|nr:hypothetical protein PVAND_012775 [Polypedilum vanderplanki]